MEQTAPRIAKSPYESGQNVQVEKKTPLALTFLPSRWRPYNVEYTGSLLTSEVKRHMARLVLGWGTAWEHPGVLPAFCPLPLKKGAERGSRKICMQRYFEKDKKGLRIRNSPMCTLSQNGYGDKIRILHAALQCRMQIA